MEGGDQITCFVVWGCISCQSEGPNRYDALSGMSQQLNQSRRYDKPAELSVKSRPRTRRVIESKGQTSRSVVEYFGERDLTREVRYIQRRFLYV